MGNSASFQITGDTAKDVQTFSKAHRHTPSAAPTAESHRKVQVDTHGDGRQVTKDLSARVVETQRQLRPGNVLIGGVETSIEAARAAGLLPPGFDRPAGNKATPAGNAQATTQDQKGAEGDQKAAEGDATDLAAMVMDTLADALGADAVESGIWQAAETGDIEASTPQGVAEDATDAIVQGFITQANNVLGSLHGGGIASVDMLLETMNDAELREARMATIHNDREKLANLGRVALGRMETLPYKDPSAFEALIVDMPADERKALSYSEERREWVVKLPGKQAMSFGSAVRAGIVRVG